MAYESGTTSSWSDLRSKLSTFLAANGWSVASNLFYKDGCYVEIVVDALGGQGSLRITGGDGKTGGNELTGTPQGHLQYAWLTKPAKNIPVEFPCNYYLHLKSTPNDEVILVLNYSSDAYINLGFGKSPAEGNTASGNWFHASCCLRATDDYYSGLLQTYTTPAGHNYAENPYLMPFFCNSTHRYGFSTSIITSDFRANIGEDDFWCSEFAVDSSGSSIIPTFTPSACLDVSPMLSVQPNTSTGESMLLPCNIWTRVGGEEETNIYRVGYIDIVKFLRIDNLSPGQIITVGSDDYSVYPACRKNVNARDGGFSHDGYTGTLGFAVKK